jgi:hypothetical protein
LGAFPVSGVQSGLREQFAQTGKHGGRFERVKSRSAGAQARYMTELIVCGKDQATTGHFSPVGFIFPKRIILFVCAFMPPA